MFSGALGRTCSGKIRILICHYSGRLSKVALVPRSLSFSLKRGFSGYVISSR